MTRLHYAATARNREPIASVLARALPAAGLVLEVASGSGEHALHFASRFPDLVFQPTDPDPACRASIDAWREGGPPNLRPALALDARDAPWPIAHADAVLSINMIHIAPFEACEGLVRGAARVLPARGVLFLYGPFRVGAAHTAPSNAEFDASLRARDPRWGVRDLEAVIDLASLHGLAHRETVAMPANNLSVIFEREISAA